MCSTTTTMAANKKSSKNVDVISALRAFETTLRAASRHSGVPVYRPLLTLLQELQQSSKPLSEVVLSGLCPRQVVAVADCLSHYAAVKSLSLQGCSCGDQGLAAISAILQQSGSKWWMGSRLQSLELCSDCRQAPSTAAVVSPQPLSSPLPQADDPQHLSSSSSPQQCSSQRPASAPPERQRVECNAARQPAVGICPPTPGYLQLPTGAPHVPVDSRLSALRPVHYKVHAPKTLMQIRSWALAPTLGPRSTPSSPSSSKHNSSSPASAAATCCFSNGALQQLSLALGVSGLQLQVLRLDYTLLGDQGVSTLATGLGCCSSLRLLSLRGCNIGPAGAQRLAEALTPAAARKPIGGGNGSSNIISSSPTNMSTAGTAAGGSRMSMASGINPQLSALPEHGGAAAAPAQSTPTGLAAATSGGSNSSQPCLVELHLDSNPLGASGLHAVSKAVKHMASIKVLTLSDISLPDHSLDATQLEVQVLAHSLLSGPSELTTLDFSDNYISDELAMNFLGLLKSKASLTLLKLSPRLSPGVMQQITTLLTEHQQAAKAHASKKVKKGKKPA